MKCKYCKNDIEENELIRFVKLDKQGLPIIHAKKNTPITEAAHKNCRISFLEFVEFEKYLKSTYFDGNIPKQIYIRFRQLKSKITFGEMHGCLKSIEFNLKKAMNNKTFGNYVHIGHYILAALNNSIEEYRKLNSKKDMPKLTTVDLINTLKHADFSQIVTVDLEDNL